MDHLYVLAIPLRNGLTPPITVSLHNQIQDPVRRLSMKKMAEAIRYFELNTGAKIPSVGLGTWQASPGVVGAAVHTIIKIRYRHIDCAQAYGNEKEIGSVLKKLFEDGVVRREDLWCTNHAPEDVPVALNSTLQDLQLDFLDLYMIHWPASMKKGVVGFKPENLTQPDIPSTWKAMEVLFDSGKARAIRVSNFSSKKLGDLLQVARVPPAVLQVEFHPVWQQPKLHALCESNGIHITGYSPLGSPGTGTVKKEVLKHPVLNMVAEKLGKSPAQVALIGGCKWVTVFCLRALMKRGSNKTSMSLIDPYPKTCLPSFLK